MSDLPPKKDTSGNRSRNWTTVSYDDLPDRDDRKDAMTYSILGHELSLSQMAESAFAMLRDDMAAESDPTACDHRVGLPYKDGYACGTCHAELELSEFREVWVNLENGVVKIDSIGGFRNLGDAFESCESND
jgi:hypothetical protein